MYEIEVEVFNANFYKTFYLKGTKYNQLKSQMYKDILDYLNQQISINKNTLYEIEFSVSLDDEYYDYDEGFIIYDFKKKSFIIEDNLNSPIQYRLGALDKNYSY